MRNSWWMMALGMAMVLAAVTSTPARADEKKDILVDLGGLKSKAPATWKEIEVSEMARRAGRIKHLRLPKAEGDAEDTDLFLFYFTGGGGALKDNLKRWKDMFNPPEGKKIDDVFKVTELKVGKAPVTYVDVEGTYKSKKTPADTEVTLKPNYRMIAVVFDSENGPFYMRLVGPAKSVAENKKAFDDWLKAFK